MGKAERVGLGKAEQECCTCAAACAGTLLLQQLWADGGSIWGWPVPPYSSLMMYWVGCVDDGGDKIGVLPWIPLAEDASVMESHVNICGQNE